MAQALFDLINAEIDKVRSDEESLLEIEDDTFGSEKLVTASVCAWAYDIGFYIEGWKAPRHWRKKTERNYTSEYLDIIDDVISTFCEEGGDHYTPGRPPKNDAVIAYIKEKYGTFSDKIMTSIATVVRQGRT